MSSCRGRSCTTTRVSSAPACRRVASNPATTSRSSARPAVRSSPRSRRAGSAGACAVVLPLPMRMGSIEEFVDQTRSRIRNADAALLLIDPDLAPFYEPAEGDPPSVLLPDLMPGRGRPKSDAFERVEDDLERLAILQFTSGSTSEPKGVMLPQRVLCSNLDAIDDCDGTARRRGRARVVAAALPRHGSRRLHDDADDDRRRARARVTAGLPRPSRRVDGVDLDLPRHGDRGAELLVGARDPCAEADEWARPLVDAHRARTAPSPSIPMRSKRSSPRPRHMGSGRARSSARSGWPRWRSRARSRRRCGAWSATSSTVAGSRPSTWRSPSTRRTRARGGCHCSASPFPASRSASAIQKTGAVLRDREVGELEISGTSVTPGYYKRPDATAELFHDGWLRTGDLAYMLDGELVLCGRIKDVIIIGGRNVFPEDIERAIGTMDGVRAGNVIAFGVDGYKGKESVVVVAETRGRRRRSRAQGGAPACARGRGRAAARRDARRGRHDAEDVVRQAAAQPVQAALSGRRPAARLTHAVALPRAHEVEQQPRRRASTPSVISDRIGDHEDRPAALLAHHHEGERQEPRRDPG